MYVVIDSTEFYSNRLLEGVDIEIVNVHLQRVGGAVLIPKAVIDEAVKRQRALLNERHAALLKELHAFERLYRHSEPEWSPPSLNVNLESALASYESDLNLRMEELGAIILPYDGLPLGPLMSRCLECKKPFDVAGRKGFRDAVIWASVVHFLKSSPKSCYLVTNNKSDFCDGHGLHADLQDDLRSANLGPALVQVSESLAVLARALGGDKRPAGLSYTAIRPQFGLFDLHEFVAESWDDLVFEIEPTADQKAVFQRILGIKVYSDPSLDFVGFDPSTIRVYGVDRAPAEDCLLIRLTVDFSGDTELLVGKKQFVQLLRYPHPNLLRLKAKNVFAWVPVDGALEIEVVANPKTGEVNDAKVLRVELQPDLSDSAWEMSG